MYVMMAEQGRSVAAELRHKQSFLCKKILPAGRVVSAKVTWTSLNQLQNVGKELAGCW